MTSFDKKRFDENISDENISDEILSAFLDSELPEKEMQSIRDLLAADETLVNRIAEMASVDAIVSSTYHQIDEVPLPDSILSLIDDADTHPESDSSVVRFPLWDRVKSSWQDHAPLATAAALVLGLGIGLTTNLPNAGFNSNSGSSDHWSAITQVLDQQTSGQNVVISDGYSVTPRVSFTNIDQQFCRQFVLNTPSNSQHSIACHNSNGWQLQATIYDVPLADGQYRTAASEQPINNMVDSMSTGSFLSRVQEQQAIRSGWAH